MPLPENFPVVVVTRMSLSFPVLLSAVPLHSIDRQKDKEFQNLERCWFTDGGVCSNFPLHFFDGPLPRRPTFSIDLTQKPDDTAEADLVPEMDNHNMPSPMDRWNRFDCTVFADPAKPAVDKPPLGQLTGFLGTLIATMQNWNDATQSRLPGYRDRIVRIPLTSKQGGLNLNMPPELVTFLAEQGEKCAVEILRHFDPEDPARHSVMTWDNHRWIRLRTILSGLEKMCEQAVTACENPENGDRGLEKWLEELKPDAQGHFRTPSYRPTGAQIEAARETIKRLRDLSAVWKEAGTAAKNSPRPRPVLRPRPQV